MFWFKGTYLCNHRGEIYGPGTLGNIGHCLPTVATCLDKVAHSIKQDDPVCMPRTSFLVSSCTTGTERTCHC
jgi:hypothetical protein